MLNFGKYVGELREEAGNLFPMVHPTVMEDVDMPLPREIERFAQVFKLDELKDIQHDVITPGQPNRSKVGRKIAGMGFKTRQDLKKKGVLKITGNKLYITGGIVRDWLVNHFHGIAYPPDDWDLATDASPEALKLIVRAGIEKHLLPDSTELVETGEKFGNLHLSVNGKKYQITTFPFAQYESAPRMYLDSLRRNFSTNALYYSVDEKKIFDYHSGITDIYRKQPTFVGKAKRKMKENVLYPLMYVRMHTRINNKGPESVEEDARKEIKSFLLPHDVDRQQIHDEFVKGVRSALDKHQYMKILHDLGLLRQILPGVKVDHEQHIGDLQMFPMVVAQVLNRTARGNGGVFVVVLLRQLAEPPQGARFHAHA